MHARIVGLVRWEFVSDSLGVIDGLYCAVWIMLGELCLHSSKRQSCSRSQGGSLRSTCSVFVTKLCWVTALVLAIQTTGELEVG